jgi:hypothetical protein
MGALEVGSVATRVGEGGTAEAVAVATSGSVPGVVAGGDSWIICGCIN